MKDASNTSVQQTPIGFLEQFNSHPTELEPGGFSEVLPQNYDPCIEGRATKPIYSRGIVNMLLHFVGEEPSKDRHVHSNKTTILFPSYPAWEELICWGERTNIVLLGFAKGLRSIQIREEPDWGRTTMEEWCCKWQYVEEKRAKARTKEQMYKFSIVHITRSSLSCPSSFSACGFSNYCMYTCIFYICSILKESRSFFKKEYCLLS